MIDLIRGKTVEEAKKLMNAFLDMLKGVQMDGETMEQLEDAASRFAGRLPDAFAC